jgi:regulator of protease activity HflC (stomatin/prohibitin superfamily)
MKKSLLVFLAITLPLSAGCVVVKQDEVGVKRRFGDLREGTLDPGLYLANPFTTRVLTLPVRTQNLEVRIELPSKEGLTVVADISILYKIDRQKAHIVLSDAGPEYENEIILSIFRSAAADVCAQFMAKDMHSGSRSSIEEAIRDRMSDLLAQRGFIIEAVLLKSIKLPSGLSRAIEQRMAAEQDALRMTYELEREQQEAARKKVEAQGERDAQRILAEGLSPEILEWRRIKALEALATSPNAKVIITNGSPMLTTDVDAETETPRTYPKSTSDEESEE